MKFLQHFACEVFFGGLIIIIIIIIVIVIVIVIMIFIILILIITIGSPLCGASHLPWLCVGSSQRVVNR